MRCRLVPLVLACATLAAGCRSGDPAKEAAATRDLQARRDQVRSLSGGKLRHGMTRAEAERAMGRPVSSHKWSGGDSVLNYPRLQIWLRNDAVEGATSTSAPPR